MGSSELSAFSGASFSSSIGDSAEFDVELTLNDRLKVFKTSQFDCKGYITSKCHATNEKEIRHLYAYLVDLKKASAEEMRKSVYANYSAFIRTSKEISDLEGELLSMRNLLSTQAALVHGLAEGVGVDSLSADSDSSTKEDTSDVTHRNLLKWKNGERTAQEASNRQTLSPSVFLYLQAAIKEGRQKLADQLAHVACQTSTSGLELRSTVQALKKLGDGPHAHKLLLNSHHHNLVNNMRIRPSSTSYGGAFTAALSHHVFSIIAQAANDSLSVFGDEPAYASELVTWAVKETKAFALLVKRHVLATSAAAGGLRLAAECVQTCLGHCSLLEARGLALSPILLKLFRPCIEEALTTNLKRIEQSSSALAVVDDWTLVLPPAGIRPLGAWTSSLGSAIASQLKLSTSAHRFNSMVQEFFEEVGPLESLQLGGSTLEGLLQVFNSYINLLIHALPGTMETEDNLGGSGHKIVRMAETESQQLALLANASMLADELLPRGAMKLSPLHQTGRMDTPGRVSDRQNRFPEHREWKRKLQRAVDRLRDSFCDNTLLNSSSRKMVIQYKLQASILLEKVLFLSSVTSALKLLFLSYATSAFKLLLSDTNTRERFATILLMRLTETVILWLSDDQSFWGEIEAGPKPLSTFGLQQFYLDMEFVILFSSQGRYLSRHLHQVIKNIIARAIDAFAAATGTDPYSVLPEDQWFAEVAQIAMKMLTGEANFGNVDHDATSPTASILSHGST
ncbi:Exocyst complex component EXO84A [Vitis vinifera]|uniref:Exocyst complex component EXO84A n=1 Tax=Vitis vinifera TaxID=29760 RepID=A0A438HD84_VITVI|nr:Exocyst complex component EXO84A [Vitis vinifera]